MKGIIRQIFCVLNERNSKTCGMLSESEQYAHTNECRRNVHKGHY